MASFFKFGKTLSKLFKMLGLQWQKSVYNSVKLGFMYVSNEAEGRTTSRAQLTANLDRFCEIRSFSKSMSDFLRPNSPRKPFAQQVRNSTLLHFLIKRPSKEDVLSSCTPHNITSSNLSRGIDNADVSLAATKLNLVKSFIASGLS